MALTDHNAIIARPRRTLLLTDFVSIDIDIIDKDIVFQSLTKDYFQQGQDKLSNEVFVALSDIFAEHVAIIHEADLCLFIDDWLRDKMIISDEYKDRFDPTEQERKQGIQDKIDELKGSNTSSSPDTEISSDGIPF